MTRPQISKTNYALDAGARGLPVLLLKPDSDEPLLPDWRDTATADPEQIGACWALCPDANIGISTKNFLVIKFHETCGPESVAALKQLFAQHSEPYLKTVCCVSVGDTGQKGAFAVYALPPGATVQTSPNLLFPSIGVRKNDGFIVGPGSSIADVDCVFANARSEVAPAPAWLMEMCGVQLPESNSVNNVVRLSTKALTVEAAPKTKFEWVKDAVAQLHIDVFPVRGYVDPGPNATPEERLAAAKAAKTPLIKDWQNEATQDIAKLEALWREFPNANIGGATQNHIVVDIDPRNGGDATFAGLVDMGYVFPDTATTRTQSGGQHLIYIAPDGPVKGGTSKLGPGIDIKARGGYVLLPGSTIEGRVYDRETMRPPAFAPQWIVDQLKAARPKAAEAGKRIVEEDDTARELFESWMLRHAPMAYDGEVDDTTYKMCARGYDFGCSQETVYEVVSEWDQTHCFPQNNPDRLPIVVESAGRNRENAIGASHPLAPGFEVVEIAERPVPSARETATAVPPATSLATPLLQFDPVGLELRPWVIPGFACRGRVTLLAGPGGVAKSTYYLMVAIATVSGRSDICGFPILKRERVWVWNQEDDIAEMQRRVAAIMKEFDVSWDDLKDADGSPMLYLDSGVDKPLMLANRSSEHSIVPGKQVADVIATAKANRIAVLILDPLVEFHEASENDNVQMRAVVGQVRRIAVEADCATMLSTHTRKPPVASSDGFAGEMDAARGASAQLGVVRIGATIFSMSPKQAKEHRLADGTTHLDYVRIDIAKNNLAPVLPDPIWFKRVGVRVGGGFEQNGESVGVLRPVTLDKRIGTSSTTHLPTLLAEIIATKLSREKHYKVSDVLAMATPAQQALFGDKKNRARCITDAFDGSDTSPTEAGILTKISARGKEMTLYLGPSSSLPQQAKMGGRGSENDEDTEA